MLPLLATFTNNTSAESSQQLADGLWALIGDNINIPLEQSNVIASQGLPYTPRQYYNTSRSRSPGRSRDYYSVFEDLSKPPRGELHWNIHCPLNPQNVRPAGGHGSI